MKQNKRLFIYLLGLVLTAGLLFSGCTPKTTEMSGKKPGCDLTGKVTEEIATEAQVEEFSCYYKKYEGVETLHFKITVKNMEETPQRFRVNIFLDNGKAVGGLLPRTTKKGLVEPHATSSFDYPVMAMTEKPGSVTLIVKPLSQ